MTKRSQAGFTLAELVIAVVLLGVVLGPLLIFVARIQQLNAALSAQVRREAWRSFSDQCLAAGVNPGTSPALSSSTNPFVPALTPPGVVEDVPAKLAGVAQIVGLRSTLAADVAERRLVGGGLQIGAGLSVTREHPVAPLIPIVMPPPVVTPADGAIIPVSTLTAATPGAPYRRAIDLASAPGSLVRGVFNQPHASVSGVSRVGQEVTAVDLATGVNGTAWTEFAGDTAAGDRCLVLPDGRTRWFITTASKRLQIYEPSTIVSFAYRLDLGAPVIARAGQETNSGGTLAFDYAEYTALQTAGSTPSIAFPAAVTNAFGTEWPSDAVGFQWTFGSTAGPFSGSLRDFFAPEAISLWADVIPITAKPVVPPGAIAATGTWTFTRVKSALGAPVLSSTADASGFFTAGPMRFSAPARPDGSTVGRLAFDNGTTLSTGPSLSMTIIP